MNSFQFPANVNLVDEQITTIVSSLEEMNVDHRKVYQINLALEEILVNVAKYAYSSKEGIIDVSYEIDKNSNELRVVIKDKGQPFNPLEKEDPDLHSSVQDRKIGGLGIFITKNMVDNIQYRRINDENILEFSKKL